MDKTVISKPRRNVGDIVVYRNNGVCRISDIRTERFSRMEEKTYYVLHNVRDERSLIFLPLDAPNLASSMREVLSVEQIHRAIAQAESHREEWIADAKQRAAHFEQILSTGDCTRILYLMKLLSDYRDSLEREGKKFYANDARVLAAAEKMIVEEFSYALGIEKEKVIPYIRQKASPEK